MIAVTQRAHPGPGRDYFERKLAAGKSPAEARRCLKRQIANTVYRHLRDDALQTSEAARGDIAGRLQPARPAHTRTPALRDSHPGPETTLPPSLDREAFGCALRNQQPPDVTSLMP
jgi:hypothetical protein